MSKTLKFEHPAGKYAEWPKKSVGRLLKPTAVARMVGLSNETMHRLIDNGEVETVIFAGYCYIPRQEADRLEKLLTGEVSE